LGDGRFLRRLGENEFDLVVCIKGAGLAFLPDLAAANSANTAVAIRR